MRIRIIKFEVNDITTTTVHRYDLVVDDYMVTYETFCYSEPPFETVLNDFMNKIIYRTQDIKEGLKRRIGTDFHNRFNTKTIFDVKVNGDLDMFVKQIKIKARINEMNKDFQ